MQLQLQKLLRLKKMLIGLHKFKDITATGRDVERFSKTAINEGEGCR
jgi:hypothetical protein